MQSLRSPGRAPNLVTTRLVSVFVVVIAGWTLGRSIPVILRTRSGGSPAHAQAGSTSVSCFNQQATQPDQIPYAYVIDRGSL